MSGTKKRILCNCDLAAVQIDLCKQVPSPSFVKLAIKKPTLNHEVPEKKTKLPTNILTFALGLKSYKKIKQISYVIF